MTQAREELDLFVIRHLVIQTVKKLWRREAKGFSSQELEGNLVADFLKGGFKKHQLGLIITEIIAFLLVYY